jgi:AraC-like DNA-binding protein
MQATELNDEAEFRVWSDEALTGAFLAQARYGAHEFERHVHDELVIAVTEEGAGKCITRLGSDVCGPGSVWIFEPGAYHCGEVWAAKRWNYRGIYVDATGVDALASVFGGDAGGSIAVRPGLYADRQLAQLLLRAHESLDDRASVLERQARWWAAIGVLLGRYGQPRARFEELSRERSKMDQVREYLAAHFVRNITVEELSQVCGLSRFHLMRAFAREYGMPPHAYANQLRLAQARKLIAAGHGLSDAAVAAGFYDQSHLTRVFKRAYGITPGTYAGLHRGHDAQCATRASARPASA